MVSRDAYVCSCLGTGSRGLIEQRSVFVVVYRNSGLPIVVEDGSRLFVSVPRDAGCAMVVGVK